MKIGGNKMKRLITGILTGIVLTCSLIAVPLTSSTSASSQNNEPYESSPTDATDIDKEGILNTLKQAGAEINDKDIAEYYQLLVEQLDSLDGIQVSDEMDPFPDINGIVRLSASLPLQEAGKNIEDEDIARFYHDFLEDVGWEFD
jgi:hypothetical protein